jgi:AraC family transcriptional regulator
VQIESLPEQRVFAVSHVGPYNTIPKAFARLGEIAGPLGLFTRPGALMVAIYYDDPEQTPAAELRSEAGVVVSAQAQLPGELHELRIPAGRYARTTHRGPYERLGDTWATLMGRWLPESGERLGSGMMYEVYRNTPMTAKPSDLLTDLYVSLVRA